MIRHLAVKRSAAAQPAGETSDYNTRSDAIQVDAVSRDLLWRHLALSPSQLARLTGIPRSLALGWVAQGLLTPRSLKPMRFNGVAIEQAIVMREAIAQGYSPDQVAHLARRYQSLEQDDTYIPSDAEMDANKGADAIQEFIEAALRMALLDLHDAEAISITERRPEWNR